MTAHSRQPRRLVAAGLALLAVVSAGCSSAGASPTPSSAANEQITAALSEWRIDLSATSAPAGKLIFAISNRGTAAHEFLMIRTDMMAAEMPMKDDMIDIAAMGGPMGSPDMNMPGMSPSGDMEHPVGTVGVIGEVAPGATVPLTIDNVAAGHYVIVCNLSAHYEQGMRIDFAVGP